MGSGHRPVLRSRLMLLDFDEHMFHRRSHAGGFTRTRLWAMSSTLTRCQPSCGNDWVANDPVPVPSGSQELTLDIASVGVQGP